MSFDSDASVSSTSSRRSRKMWSEAEEACLISGVEKVRELSDFCIYASV